MKNVNVRCEVEPSLCFRDPLLPVCAVHIISTSCRHLVASVLPVNQTPSGLSISERDPVNIGTLASASALLTFFFIIFSFSSSKTSRAHEDEQARLSTLDLSREGGGGALRISPVILSLSFSHCLDGDGDDFKPLLCTIKYPILRRSPTLCWKSAELHTPDLPSAEARQSEIF